MSFVLTGTGSLKNDHMEQGRRVLNSVVRKKGIIHLMTGPYGK